MPATPTGNQMRKLMAAAAIGIVLLGACSGGGGKKAKSASTTTTSQTNCDFAQTFTTNKIGASLTEAQAHTIASLAPEEIRSDVETVLLGAVKAQQVGQSSKSPRARGSVHTAVPGR